MKTITVLITVQQWLTFSPCLVKCNMEEGKDLQPSSLLLKGIKQDQTSQTISSTANPVLITNAPILSGHRLLSSATESPLNPTSITPVNKILRLGGN